MKSSTSLNIVIVGIFAALVCGCQKPEDKSAQEAVRLLQDIKTAVSATHRKGEAFVVLQSDAVIYMADMEILGFKPDFRQHLITWKRNWEAAYKNQLRDFASKNPELQAQLKNIDEEISFAFSKTNAMKQAATESITNVIRELQAEAEGLHTEKEKGRTAYEEYTQIVTPFDEKLTKLRLEMDNLEARDQKLAIETLDKINHYIVENQLAIPTLKDGQSLFTIQSEDSLSFSPERRPASKSFYVARERNKFGGYKWVFLKNIPDKLEGTSIGLPVITSGYYNHIDISSKIEETKNAFLEQRIAKDTALIPWENRHSTSQHKASDLVSKQEELATKLKGITERLNKLQSTNGIPSDAFETEIRSRVQEVEKEIAELNSRRDHLIKDKAETAALDLKLEFKGKFYQLLRAQAESSVQTGSRGDFSVPAKIAYIYAERHRENGETLVWLLRVDPNSLEVRLSNSNSAISREDADPFWMLSWNLD